MADEINQAIDIFARSFNLPSSWFTGSQVIPLFIIPMVSWVIFWYIFLNSKLKLLSNSFINFFIALAVAFMSSFVLGMFSPAYIFSMSIGAIILVMGNFSFKRLVLAIAVILAAGYLYSYLVGFLA